MYAKMKIRDNKRAYLIKKVAQKHGVSKSLVEKCVAGTRNNDEILSDLDDLNRAVDALIEDYQNNKLMHAVKDLVPF